MRIILMIACMVIAANVLAQDSTSYIKGRWNIKVSGAGYTEDDEFHPRTNPDFRVEANYGFFKYVEAGIYGGYTFVSKGRGSFGVNINIHALPLFVKRKNFRFDLYLSGKFGVMPYASSVTYFGNKDGTWEVDKVPGYVSTSYRIGVGAAFYIFRHTGLFAEYGYECFNKGELADQANLRFGLTFKF